jgi:hypothetical protein
MALASAFQADRGGVGGHVRAGFVDDADDADGDGHLLHVQARRAHLSFQHAPHRVRQGRDFEQALAHVGVDLVADAQAFEQRRGQSGLFGLGHVLGIRLAQFVTNGVKRVGHGGQGSGLGGPGDAGERIGGGAGAFAHGADLVGNRHRRFHREGIR